jgi:serine/threonine-protein kinase RsbW
MIDQQSMAAETDTVVLGPADSKIVKPVCPMLRVFEQNDHTVSLAIGGMHPRDFAKAPEHIRHEVRAIEIERMIVRLSMSGCMDPNVIEARRRMDAFAQVSEDGDVRPEYIRYLLERRRIIERLFQGHPRKLMIGNNPGKLDRHAPLHPDLADAQSIAFQTIGTLLPSEPMTLNIKLNIALQESIANHIRHGNCCDPTKIFTAEVGNTRDRLSIVFQDEGWGFDPSRVNDPTAPEHLETVSGRGITLMTEFMDSVEYNNNGRRCVMIKNL